MINGTTTLEDAGLAFVPLPTAIVPARFPTFSAAMSVVYFRDCPLLWVDGGCIVHSIHYAAAVVAAAMSARFAIEADKRTESIQAEVAEFQKQFRQR